VTEKFPVLVPPNYVHRLPKVRRHVELVKDDLLLRVLDMLLDLGDERVPHVDQHRADRLTLFQCQQNSSSLKIQEKYLHAQHIFATY
jgi:hypothetical protein